ncbi:ABC transporter permease [Cuneatibacter sp. NSJ-177]|uniref:ABC transporter permease n=1 Tax=Cuneatibacter sp. NSJ-177 TaxID=2931401 RepID=UPI001FD119DD|nr:ABC transporter permease [Cuneatibacter sp. NSJ-177]MCJ7836624.1 ABC transporter permease [Cuneatibacter sp. NSJ-177]
MSRYILQRIGRGLLTIFVSLTLTFFIIRLMPSNPVELMIDPHMSQETQDMLMEKFGLDKSFGEQYILFLKGVVQGDLGVSFGSRANVTELIAQKLPWTLLLIGIVLLLVVIIGIPVGVLAAKRKGRLSDRIISIVVTMGISIFIPFLAFLLLYLFSFRLGVLPTAGAYTPPKGEGFSYVLDIARHAILPAVTLSVMMLANAVLYTRNSMIDVLKEDYIRTAYSKGLDKKRTLKVHALKNALIPTVTVIGLQIGVMVGGSVMTETVFSWPGIGRMIYDAVTALDYPVLQGGFLLMSVSVVLMNFLTDLVVAWLDPRIKLGGK